MYTTRFADRDMFVRFTGGGIGHQNTALATRIFRVALLKLFAPNFNDDTINDDTINDQDHINDPNDGDNSENGSDAPEDEEWEDIDDDTESTDFEDDGGECGADEEEELGFGSF
jgi:hypothetical protein